MNFIAHRGLVNNAKDNSYESLINGLESSQYVGVETDVRMTKDKEFVLYHNVLFNGKLVSNVNYKEMKKERIMKLEELLGYETKKIVMLEIKDGGIDKKKFLKLLDKYKRNYYIMSFSNKFIREFRDITDKYKVGILNYVFNTEEEYRYDFICILNSLLTDNMIEFYKKKNIEVIGYGVLKGSRLNEDIVYIIDDEVLRDLKNEKNIV